jgi:hypothetical protein
MKNIEDIHDLNLRMDLYVQNLSAMITGVEAFLDEKPQLESDMAKLVCEYMLAHPDIKKPSWDKLEGMAAISPEQRVMFYRAKLVRAKVELATTMLDALKTGIGAVQSQMKFNSIPVNYKEGNHETR